MKFKPLTTKEGLSNNSVNDIISDKYGKLWIATWDGLNVYDGTSVIVYKHIVNDSASLAGNTIFKLLKDKDQRIWILTDNQTVSYYLGDGKFKQFHFEKQPEGIHVTRDGGVAVSFNDHMVAYVNNKFQSISQNKIKRHDDLNVLREFLIQKYPEVTVNDIFKDNEGNIWYATRKNGLYIIPNTAENVKNEFIEHYTYDLYSPYSFTSNEIEKIYQDDAGNIWLAHKDGGVSMAYNGAEQITTIIPHPVKFPHLPNETVRAITKDINSTIWLGYYTKGLYFFNEKTKCFVPYIIAEAQNNSDWNRIRSLYTDSKGTVWAGTYKGLIKITKNGYKLFNAEKINSFPYNRNYSVFEDEASNLWVGCWGGIGKLNLNTDTFDKFSFQQQLNKYHIRHVIKQRDTLVLATEDCGVIFFTEKKGIVKKLTVKNGLLGNSTYCIYFDADTGNYWIATLGGISVYNPRKGIVKNITEKDGLPSHMVYGLLSNKQAMWISTTKGIATIDKESFDIFQLPKDLGWQAEEFSEGAAYQDKKGMLFFGGINGFSFFQPDAFHFSQKPPKIQVIVDNKENFPSTIVKDYNNNNLEVHIGVVSFSSMHSVIYYKLEGADSEWKTYNGEDLLYRNLAPGKYNFITRIDTDDKTVKQHLKIRIKKPFYLTTWFYLCCLLLVFLIISIIIIRKNIATKKLQHILENKIAERTQIIENQKEELLEINKALEQKHKEVFEQSEQVFALHHELKNRDFEVDKFKTFVLSGFKPKLAKMMTEIEAFGNTDAKKSLEKHLIDLTQTLYEWDYLDKVSALGTVASTHIKFKSFIQRVYEQIQPANITFKAVFKYTIESSTDEISVDALRLKLLFQYLLNEILKYIDTSSSLTVNTTLYTKELNIVFHSNSTLLLEQWDNISKFSPYFRAFETLLKDLNGNVSFITSEGFTIAINIPVANAEEVLENSGVLLLKHLEDTEQKHKPSILIYCEAEELSLIKQLFKESEYQLIFEHDCKALPSALQQINIKALVLYNTLFSAELVQVLNQPMFKQLPELYIAENIDLEKEEKVMDYGINSIIYLPVNSSFIQKKLSSLIQQQKVYSSKLPSQLVASEIDSAVLNPNEKIVKQALERIRLALGDADFNVDRLITEMEISRTKCYRVFKDVLNQSPSDVIINLRLQKAEQLLVSGHLNISEISFECGFNDPKYFSRMFKKYFGVSPKTYKQKHKTSQEF